MTAQTVLHTVKSDSVMSDYEYDAERARLRETYGDTAEEAGVKFEQALARLFHRSGWTQQKLADKRG